MGSSDSILAGIGATVLAVTLAVLGFAFCCMPATTNWLASQVSTGEDSPYTHEQLVRLAGVTRTYTVDQGSIEGESPAAEVARTTLECAREASAEGSPKAAKWSDEAKRVLAEAAEGAEEGETPEEAMDELARVSDRYALDSAAMTHLDDCYRALTGVSSWLGMIGVAALIIVVLLFVRKQFGALAFMLRMGPALLAAILVALGLWAVVDFNGLFAVFHSFFFEDGTWTFPADSLLISMYPLGFWRGMAGVWAVGALGLGMMCVAAGFVAAWRAKQQSSELAAEAARTAKKSKKGKKSRG